MQKYQEANSVRGKDIVNAMDDIDVIDMVSPPLLGKCPCRSEPLTDTGKRIQLLKMLCLTVIPILGLWGFTVNTLTDTINKKTENEKTKKELYLSVELGELIHHLQQERDMSVLYLSALGPETKTFLLTEYILTDKAIYALSDWPSNLDNEKRQEFESKDKLQEYLSRHRQLLSKVKYDINAELEFYTNIIDVVIVWLYKSITRNKFAQVWKTLVAYLKLTSGKQDVGYERAIGTLFYVQGGFQSMDYFEMYNNRINRFKAFYKTAELYSARVDRLYTSGVEGVGTNITGIINKFRYEIQHHMNRTEPDIQKARYWFDNMTLYLDTLLEIQQDLGYEIIENLNIFILDSTADLSVSATFLVVVLLMCPFVVFATESLTSSIQKYALSLVHKTHELIIEKKKTDSLLHQMVPRPVAEKLKKKIQVHAEYFKSVTIFFSDIFGFSRITTECTPIDIVELLNTLYGTIDALLDDYDVYKVETINDCYMVASGLPNRNGNKHVAEVANFALALLKLIIDKQYTISGKRVVKLRIGMNSGTCMAGIVGSILPRYCLFGDTVNTASRMKSYGCPNRIQISPSTNNALVKLGTYVTKKRGTLSIKGKGEMRTFWLLGKTDDDDIIFPDSDSEEEIVNTNNATEDLPGEIIEYTSFKSALPIPLPGRTTKCGIASLEEKSITREEKITARVLPTQVTENKPNLLEPTVKSMPKDDKNVKNTEKSQEKASDSSRTIKSDTPTKFPESSLAAKIELQQILERVESSSPIIVGKTFLPGDSPKKNASGSRNDTPSYSLICEDRPPVAHVRATINSTKSESQSSSSTDNTDKTKPPLQK